MGWGTSSRVPWGPPTLKVFPQPLFLQSLPGTDTFTSAHPPPRVTLGSGGSPIPPERSLHSHARAATLSSCPWREEETVLLGREATGVGAGLLGCGDALSFLQAPPPLSSDTLETTGRCSCACSP